MHCIGEIPVCVALGARSCVTVTLRSASRSTLEPPSLLAVAAATMEIAKKRSSDMGRQGVVVNLKQTTKSILYMYEDFEKIGT